MLSLIMPIKELEDTLNRGNAHASFEDAVAGIPQKILGDIPSELPYSLWQPVEHTRFAKADILEFCRNPDRLLGIWD